MDHESIQIDCMVTDNLSTISKTSLDQKKGHAAEDVRKEGNASEKKGQEKGG